MDWFRYYHGASMDPKWRTVARLSGASPLEVSGIFCALLDYASQQADRGSIDGFDFEVAADFYNTDPEKIAAIIDALTAKGVIVDGRLANWDKRQPGREDSSTDRTRLYRERMRKSAAEAETIDVTQENASAQHCDAPVTHGDASVTHGDAPDTDTDSDSEQNRTESSSLRSQRVREEFSVWWQAYPHKVGKNAAEPAYRKALARASPEELLAGVKRYVESKPRDRPWCNPATWLNQGRWEDEPAPTPEPINGSHGILTGLHRPKTAATERFERGTQVLLDAVLARERAREASH